MSAHGLVFGVLVLAKLLCVSANRGEASIAVYVGEWAIPAGPSGVGVGPDGSIWVAADDDIVRKYDPDGNFLLQMGSSGSGDGQFLFPYSFAFGADGGVYISDYANHRIQEFTQYGNLIRKWSVLGTRVTQIGFDADFNLYASNYIGSQVWKFDSTGVTITSWSVPKSSSLSVVGHSIQVVAFDTGHLLKYTLTGDSMGDLGAMPGGTGSEQMAVDACGRVYLAAYSANQITAFTLYGSTIGVLGGFGSGSGQFSGPEGVTVSASNHLYVADRLNHRIQKFQLDDSPVVPSPFATLELSWGLSDGPSGVRVGPDGRVWVTADDHKVHVFSSTGTALLEFGGYGTGPSEFIFPYGLAFGLDGSAYVTDYGNHRVQQFTPTGSFIREWNIPGPRATGIDVDSHGDVYVADFGNRVWKFTSDGTPILSWTTGSKPNGLVTYADRVYVGIYSSGEVAAYTLSGDFGDSFPVPHGLNAGLMTHDNVGRFFIAGFSDHVVSMWRGSTSYGSIGGFACSDGGFSNPEGVGASSDGRLYVADRSHRRIQRFLLDATTGVISPKAADGLVFSRLCPNPASERLTVSFSIGRPGRAKLEILDMAGRRQWARDTEVLTAGGHVMGLETRGLRAGIYLIRLTHEGHRVSSAFSVVR